MALTVSQGLPSSTHATSLQSLDVRGKRPALHLCIDAHMALDAMVETKSKLCKHSHLSPAFLLRNVQRCARYLVFDVFPRVPPDALDVRHKGAREVCFDLPHT